MKPSEGDVVEVVVCEDVEARLHRRIGVVDAVDDACESENCIVVSFYNGDGFEGNYWFREDELKPAESDDLNIVLASYLNRSIHEMAGALTCSHTHIERDCDSDLKCTNCGLKTSGMPHDVSVPVIESWGKRLI